MAESDLEKAELFERRLISEGSPFALCNVTLSGAHYLTFRHGPQSVIDIFRKAVRHGGAPLLIDRQGSVSYETAFRQASRLASAFRTRFGVRNETRIGIALGNNREAAIAFVAAIIAGGTAVLIGRQAEAERIWTYAGLAGCTVLVVEEPEFSSRSDGNVVVGRCEVSRQGLLEHIPLSELIAGESSTFHGSDVKPEDDAIIAFTSGTTGRPKGVVLSHRGVSAGLMNTMLAGCMANLLGNPTARTRPSPPVRPCALLVSPFAHASGYMQFLLQMTLGGKLVLEDELHPDRIARTVAEEKVRSIIGLTPAATHALLGLASGSDLSSLTSFHIYGYPLHRRLVEAIAERLPLVTVGTSYGMTETNGAICALAGESLRLRPESSGRIVPTVDVKVTDVSGRELPSGETGEIWLRGAMLLRGYCDSKPLRNGWLRTGDTGWVSDDRFLTVADRVKNLIQIDGRTISSTAIERLVAAIGGVEDAVVFAAGDDYDELVVAVVSSKDSTSNTERIRGPVVEQTGIEPGIIFVGQIPRNPSGKVDIEMLRAIAEVRTAVGSS